MNEVLMNIQEVVANHTNSIIKGHFSSPDIICQCCHQKPKFFKLHESRKRQFRLVVENIVETTVSFLLRWRCQLCNTTFSEYPSFAVPHKRFVLTDINKFGQKYLANDRLSYRNVVSKNGADIGYPDARGLCDRFLSHSSVWRFMIYLADNYQANRHYLIPKQIMPIISPLKYRSNSRRALLYKAFKEIRLFNRKTNMNFFPDFETGPT